MREPKKDYSKLDGAALAVERTELAYERNVYALQRTRLANKRTFLAWSRTALAIMGFGFILERVDAFILAQTLSNFMERELTHLGMASFILGPVTMVVAIWRYVALERALGFGLSDVVIIPELVIFLVLIGLTLYHVFS